MRYPIVRLRGLNQRALNNKHGLRRDVCAQRARGQVLRGRLLTIAANATARRGMSLKETPAPTPFCR
eukprot:11184401-Lingulodinium_polyedra.AAC.1